MLPARLRSDAVASFVGCRWLTAELIGGHADEGGMDRVYFAITPPRRATASPVAAPVTGAGAAGER
jgi:hypothetical protein